jgi:transcriptional regulator with XRE-family HTH domain/tetratricopeptide (TPR) repeat protein
MAVPSETSFAALLRQLRKAAGLTQEDLAHAAQLSSRAVSDLERGLALTARKDTARRLADALDLAGAARAQFEAAARGRSPGARLADGALATVPGALGDPQALLRFVVTELDASGVAAARSAVARWRDHSQADPAWLAWADGLITLAAEGKLPPAARRPLPSASRGSFLDREQQTADLRDFLGRVEQGRGGLAIVLGPAGMGKSRLLIKVLTDQPAVRAEWTTFDRGEAGYQGWRRLLAPLWIALRRTEIPPASLLAHATTLDEILLVGSEIDPAGRPFPGEVAAAVAAMLIHLARRPLVLVIDDAHRGGTSSDQLLLAVTRRVNSYGVGLIAALRPDELEDQSPLRDYCDQADGRAAADTVTPIRLPPFSLDGTADLLRERIGTEPPMATAAQVLRQTGGRPQLINATDLHVAPGGVEVGSWAVGKLDAEGLRVLESTVDARPEAARRILQAAALCAGGGSIEAEFIARIADHPVEFVERILDQERQRGPILAPQASGYRFEHDNWIDVLVSTCPPAQRRVFHARCLDLLKADPTSDPRQRAWHAIGAGPTLVGAKELVTLAREAADLAVANYAFGVAAELYEAAARNAAGPERIDLLIKQSDSLRFGGRWAQAREALESAASLARTLDLPGSEAVTLVHLERLTWDYGLTERELTRRTREVIDRLPPGETALRAEVQAVLARRLCVTTREYDNEPAHLARAALQQLPSVTDPLARAEILLGARFGLQDSAPPEELLDLDQQILELAIELHSAYHISEALILRITDLIRSGRLVQVPAAVRAHRDFMEQSAAPVVVYSQALIDAMFALARGDFKAADTHTSEAARLSEPWGDSMAREALMAQAGWLLYETGQFDGLTELLTALPGHNVSSLNEPVWSLGAGLIHAEKGETESAVRILREICRSTRGLADLPHGPSRAGILALAAMLLGHPAVCDVLPPGDATGWGGSIADLLIAHHDTLVIAGWPAFLLGSKQRFIGLANLAAGRLAEAAVHLKRAIEENSEFAPLLARTRFDLARSLIAQPASYAEGITEMERVRQRATELAMPSLAAQAATERDRQPPRRFP